MTYLNHKVSYILPFMTIYCLFIYFQKKRIPLKVSLLVSISVLIGLYHFHHSKTDTAKLFDRSFRITAKVISSPKVSERSISSLIEILSIDCKQIDSRIKVKLIISKTSDLKTHKYGDIISGHVIIDPIDSLNKDLTYQLRNYFFNKNIYGNIFYFPDRKGNTTKLKVIENKGNILVWAAFATRKYILKVIDSIIPEPYNYIVQGLLIGDHHGGIPDETKDAFRKTGITHILVVSGSQIALITGMTMFLFGNVIRKKYNLFLVVTVVNLVFAFISGADASIVRAVIMMEMSLFAKLINRRTNPVYTMFIVALVMVSYRPSYLTDLSFLLSYLATFGLIVISPVIEQKLSSIKYQSIRKLLAVAIAPHLMTTPISMYYFASYSFSSLPVNIIIAPIIELIVYAGFIAIIVSFISLALSKMLFLALLYVVKIMTWIVSLVAVIPYSVISVSINEMAALILVYVVIAHFLLIKDSGRKFYSSVFIALLFITTLIPTYSEVVDKQILGKNLLEVHFLSVGNGLCTHIKTPDGKNIVYDMGGRPEGTIGKSIVLPYLRKQGINRIDYVVLSHGHSDHYDGLDYVRKNIHINNVLVSGYRRHNSAYGKLVDSFPIGKVLLAQSGLHYDISEVKVDFYVIKRNDSIGERLDEDQLNDHSVLMLFRYKDFEVLLTGDIEAEATATLIKSDFLPQVDVLLIPHHGAANSRLSTLIRKIRPKISVISCGKKNKFGHPHKSTIHQLNRLDIPVYRTDNSGTIVVKSDGNKIITYSTN